MWIWIAALAVGTFVIAAASIGSVTGTLAQRPRRSVYDLAEATHFVADRLPEDVTARLSYDQVEVVLGAHCDYLTERGVASGATDDTVGDDLVVVEDDEVVAWILGRLEELREEADDAPLADAISELTDDDVVAVLDCEADYYSAIGVFGPQVDT